MIYGLLPLLILAAIIALIVRAVRTTSSGAAREGGTVSLRRFFVYITLFGTLVVVGIGLAGLVEQVLPGSDPVIRRGSTENARSLAFVLVGLPVYLGLAAWVRRQLDDARERRSFGLSFYLSVSLITALLVAGSAVFQILGWLFGVFDYEAAFVAAAIVWSSIWASHWVLIRRYLDQPRGEGHLLAGSAIGLIAAASALGFGLTIILDALYANLFEVGVASGFGDDIATAGAGLVVGGAVWWLYWLRNASRLARTRLWHAYVLLLGVLGGLTTALGAATGLLFATLIWFFGQPEVASAARYFDFLPPLLASVAIGGGLFFYHRAVLAETEREHRSEVRRVYEYIVAAVGLLGFAGGITVLVVALIQQLAPAGEVLGGESDVEILLGAISFIVVGAPLWWGFWSRIQRIRATDPDSELRSRTRRGYLAVLFGLGGVAALISLVVVVFRVLEDLFEGRFGASTINDVAPAIALVVTTGAIAGYHWQVFKEDRGQAPAALRSPLQEVVLVGIETTGLADRIAEELDVRVSDWERLDEPGGAPDPEAVIAELQATKQERVLLIGWDAGHRVVPFASSRR